MSRFQLRRWPAGCAPLVGELAVVDTKHKDRIVRTYRDNTEGSALDRATRDVATWNANPPLLAPRFIPHAIAGTYNPDGSITRHVQRTEPRFFDESSYADYEYIFPPHESHSQRSLFNGARG